MIIPSTYADEEQIKSVIKQYFDLKYESLHDLKLEDFGHLVSRRDKAQRFLQEETDKREIEIFKADINELRYLKYDYFLEYDSIKIREQTETAVVTVIEGHDVVFETSPDITSSMRNLKHSIVLRKEDNEWMIVRDNYNDDLRKYLDKSGLSKNQIFKRIRIRKEKKDGKLLDEIPLNIPNDIVPKVGKWYSSYNRTSATSYAKRWAYKRNSKFGDFSNMGGDCTNFASQVINAGGAPMDSTGNYLWYYYGYNSRSPSWTGVNELYDYLVGNTYTGPVGSLTSDAYVEKGDIIQLDFEGDDDFDHSPVVVNKRKNRSGGIDIWIAAHSVDRYNYPLASYDWEDIRFISIKGYYD